MFKECSSCKGNGGWYKGINGNSEWIMCDDCTGTGYVQEED